MDLQEKARRKLQEKLSGPQQAARAGEPAEAGLRGDRDQRLDRAAREDLHLKPCGNGLEGQRMGGEAAGGHANGLPVRRKRQGHGVSFQISSRVGCVWGVRQVSTGPHAENGGDQSERKTAPRAEQGAGGATGTDRVAEIGGAVRSGRRSVWRCLWPARR